MQVRVKTSQPVKEWRRTENDDMLTFDVPCQGIILFLEGKLKLTTQQQNKNSLCIFGHRVRVLYEVGITSTRPTENGTKA